MNQGQSNPTHCHPVPVGGSQALGNDSIGNQATPSFVICATDTEVGKTTFSLLWAHAQENFSSPSPRWAYFKPVETGDSDSISLRALAPSTLKIHPPLGRFQAAMAPHRAAALEGAAMPTIAKIASDAKSLRQFGPLFLESFGSPFSPWDDSTLQVELFQDLAWPMILIGSTTVGGVGRMLGLVTALKAIGIHPRAIVLFGEDAWTEDELKKRLSPTPVIRFLSPEEWTPEGLSNCARSQLEGFVTLAELLIKPTHSNTSQTLIDRDAKWIWHPYAPTRLRETPLPVIGSRDEFVTLADGREVIDAISSWWTILYGHKGNRLSSEMSELALDHVQFAGITHPGAIDLAGILLESAKMPQGRVFYSDNGSTAVEVALKLAFMYWRKLDQPGRTLFVGFENAYHGDTFATMAIARHPLFTKGFEGFLFEARISPVDPEALDRLLQKESGKVAAVVLEPLIQGAAGMVMHSPETLAQIMNICHRHNVLFIADEVMTGSGRTGKIWAHEHAREIEASDPPPQPDLIAAGKTLGGGFLPLAATLVSPKLVEVLDSDDPAEALFHGHSYTAHAIACALGAKYWKQLTTEGPVDSLRIEAFWKNRLARLNGLPSVKEIRIQGSIAAIELALPPGYISPVRAQAVQIGLEHGVLWRPLGNVLYAMPPYCTSEASLEKIAKSFDSAVDFFSK